jgi:hypothetical protein
MIQESRFLIEMADTVQEKIIQCQKAGNFFLFYLKTTMIILGRIKMLLIFLLKSKYFMALLNYTLSYTYVFVL